MRHCPLTYVTVFFLQNFEWGENVSKRKKRHFFLIFLILKILKSRDSSVVALLILRHFI